MKPIKFSPSQLGRLFTGSRTKGVEFGKVAETYLAEVWGKEIHGRYTEIRSKYISKIGRAHV